MVATRTRDILDSAVSIHFSLNGMLGGGRTLEQAVERGGRGIGKGTVTNWELYHIVNNPELMHKTTFYLNGVIFTFPPGLVPESSEQN